MTDMPNHINADGTIRPFTNAEMAQWQADILVSSTAVLVPETITRRQFSTQLAVDGDVTWDEAIAFASGAALPTALANAVAQIPTTADANAQVKVKLALLSVGTFDRHNSDTLLLATLLGKTDAQMDAIWIAGAAIKS